MRSFKRLRWWCFGGSFGQKDNPRWLINHSPTKNKTQNDRPKQDGIEPILFNHTTYALPQSNGHWIPPRIVLYSTSVPAAMYVPHTLQLPGYLERNLGNRPSFSTVNARSNALTTFPPVLLRIVVLHLSSVVATGVWEPFRLHLHFAT